MSMIMIKVNYKFKILISFLLLNAEYQCNTGKRVSSLSALAATLLLQKRERKVLIETSIFFFYIPLFAIGFGER